MLNFFLPGTKNVAQLGEGLSNMHEALGLILALYEVGACDPSTWKVEADGLWT